VEADPRLKELWAALDDWRAAAAVKSGDVDEYLQLAHLLASDRDGFRDTVESRRRTVGVAAWEKPILKRLSDILNRPGPEGGRVEALRRLLDGRLFTDRPEHRKIVVFCGDPELCDRVAEHLRARSPRMGLVAAHARMKPEDRRDALA